VGPDGAPRGSEWSNGVRFLVANVYRGREGVCFFRVNTVWLRKDHRFGTAALKKKKPKLPTNGVRPPSNERLRQGPRSVLIVAFSRLGAARSARHPDGVSRASPQPRINTLTAKKAGLQKQRPTVVHSPGAGCEHRRVPHDGKSPLVEYRVHPLFARARTGAPHR